MRLVTFRHGGEDRPGFLVDDLMSTGTRERSESCRLCYAIAFIQSGEGGRREADPLIADAPAAARIFLAPVTLTAAMWPLTLLCSGSNHRDHNKEKANTPISGKEPEFFVRPPKRRRPREPIIYDPALTKARLRDELAVVMAAGKTYPGRVGAHHAFAVRSSTT